MKWGRYLDAVRKEGGMKCRYGHGWLERGEGFVFTGFWIGREGGNYTDGCLATISNFGLRIFI